LSQIKNLKLVREGQEPVTELWHEPTLFF